jgi:hypothetical protein
LSPFGVIALYIFKKFCQIFFWFGQLRTRLRFFCGELLRRAYGAVYKCKRIEDDKLVAVKLVPVGLRTSAKKKKNGIPKDKFFFFLMSDSCCEITS